jgi:hypothetical protein|nr:MAG TPA: hypothetical protein [Caudoviricetes sp.]
MDKQQRWALDNLNNQVAEIGEGLKALGDLIEAADTNNAPMPYQLACLVRVICQATCTISLKIGETLVNNEQ